MITGAQIQEQKIVELLNEVYNGIYQNFKEYVWQENITTLEVKPNISSIHFGFTTLILNVKLVTYNLGHLGRALQGTNVEKVILNGNHINDFTVFNFCLHLEGTHVSTVKFANHCINGSSGLKDIAPCISHTFLMYMKMDGYANCESLQYMLELNRKKWLFTPYRVATLTQLPPRVRNKYAHLPALTQYSTEEDKLKFAAGIIMRCSTKDVNIAAYIMNFLPYMNIHKAKSYLDFAKEKHPHGLEIDNKEKSSRCLLQ